MARSLMLCEKLCEIFEGFRSENRKEKMRRGERDGSAVVKFYNRVVDNMRALTCGGADGHDAIWSAWVSQLVR